jgi:hypothetical protein
MRLKARVVGDWLQRGPPLSPRGSSALFSKPPLPPRGARTQRYRRYSICPVLARHCPPWGFPVVAPRELRGPRGTKGSQQGIKLAAL